MAERLRVARAEWVEWVVSLVVVISILAASAFPFRQLVENGWPNSTATWGGVLFLIGINFAHVLVFGFRFWRDPRFLR